MSSPIDGQQTRGDEIGKIDDEVVIKAQLINFLVGEELIVSQDRFHESAFGKGIQATIALIRLLHVHGIKFRVVCGNRACENVQTMHMWVEVSGAGILDPSKIVRQSMSDKYLYFTYVPHKTVGEALDVITNNLFLKHANKQLLDSLDQHVVYKNVQSALKRYDSNANTDETHKFRKISWHSQSSLLYDTDSSSNC